MTDKLKCPFCGVEFDIMKGISDSVLGCPKCKHIATIGVWEALIDGKKARDKLDKVDKMLFSLVLKAHDLTALDLLQGITDIRLKIIKFITKQGK